MKKILLTNDDGIRSMGILSLMESLSEEYDVFTVAPSTEKSAVSMALTLNSPLRVNKLRENFYSVDGTPSDCVNIAMRKLVKKKPDIVISGMNMGENLSEDILYSGTVGGAFSGFLYDVPALAVSMISDKDSYSRGKYDFESSAEIVKDVARKLLSLSGLKGIYNMNIPYKNNKKVIVTSLGNKRYKPDIIERTDPRGKKYYWIGTGNPTSTGKRGSDIWAVKNGYISLSPLRFNLNCFESSLKLEGIFDEI
ncbi:MAG: 5'/3'-nucleotidase SurE [Acidobacteriota bacterium]